MSTLASHSVYVDQASIYYLLTRSGLGNCRSRMRTMSRVGQLSILPQLLLFVVLRYILPMYGPRSPISDLSANSWQYLRLILDSKVYDVAEITPLTRAESLSDRLQCNVLLKREDLQPISSYKLRGIYNKMAHLNETKKWRGVITYSTGKMHCFRKPSQH
jgi:hypothetical protein